MDLATLSKRDLVQELVARRDLAETCWLDLCEVAYRVIAAEAWTSVGYVDATRFFEDYVHVSYRGLRRSLTIFEGFQALPEADREEAKDALVRIGRHKAEVLVPILKDRSIDWRPWAERAGRLAEDALREEVNAVTGNGRATPPADKPGEKFLRALLVYVPDDAKAEVEEVFALGRKLWGENNVNVLLSLVREARIEWEHRAAEKYR